MILWKRNLLIAWIGSFATTAGMSLVIPFLPLYIQLLGVQSTAEVEQWAGMAFGSTFLMSAIVSPIWGRLADRRGRKLMLLRASLGMAIVMTAMGFVTSVYQLVGLRLLMGAVSGYIAAAITLIATQTPKEHSGWALGTLSTGTVGGNLMGPLIGGYLAEAIGLRHVFFVTGGFMMLAFLITLIFAKEHFAPPKPTPQAKGGFWAQIPNRRTLWALFLTTFMLQLANMSIEPIVTVYVTQLAGNTEHIALISGAVVAAAGFANAMTASWLGRISDRLGPHRILFAALLVGALVFIPQAYVRTPWELLGLRLLLGVCMAGMLPSINSLIKRNVPEAMAGRVFGYNQSAQYLGNIGGPLLGSQTAAHFGFHYVFFSTSFLLLVNALWLRYTEKHAGLVHGSRHRHRLNTG
ncbi:multidrug efflux MFS transporter [Kyrpidia spormannii]|uniref:Multidrug resistance protein MdtG n=1 Tax=Kyrpidia spormannii TaxID=2055160 RepID=A0A6F9EB56_9BACL|nr:multidrug efflux MFS transporter [Kyrpidia spormannii]CAB3393720.1 Multidrug resistance protein MdtG [Kyrpidia spormannii]